MYTYNNKVIGGLVALFCLFTGCEKELGGNGAARIRIEIADVPYGVEDGAVRSGREAKKETVVVPLEGTEGLCLYATLEENIEGKNNALRAFTPGARLRIGVYDGSDNFVKSVIGSFTDNVFTLDGGETLDDVPTGAGYTFVAYSVNSTTEDPDYYKVGEALEEIFPDDDLLYGKSSLTTIQAGVNSVVIPLKHKFSEVTVVADASAIAGAGFNGVDAELIPAYTANMELIGANAGVLSAGAYMASQSLMFPYNTNAPVVRSAPRLVFTDGANPIKVSISNLYINWEGPALGISEIPFGFALASGTRYTLTIELRTSSTGLWAGSNIYWDGEKMTFDAMGVTGHALYQGVYFYWGSLVGISASEYWVGNSTKIYAPDYNSSEPEESTWSIATPNTQSISGMSGLAKDYTAPALYNNSNTTSYGNKQGDICRYIGDTGAGPSGYRMPTLSEFNLDGLALTGSSVVVAYSASYWSAGGSFSYLQNYWYDYEISYSEIFDGCWAGDAGGTSSISGHMAYMSALFPASGRRYNAELEHVGHAGYYWTGSSNGPSRGGGYIVVDVGHLSFTLSGMGATVCVIRCIKHI